MLLAKLDELRQSHHLAVVGDDLTDRGHRHETGKLEQVDARFGVARAGAYPAVECTQRQDVPRSVQARRYGRDVCEDTQGVRALGGADAGAFAVGGIHGDRVRRVQGILVIKHHERQLEAVRDFVRHRCADEP